VTQNDLLGRWNWVQDENVVVRLWQGLGEALKRLSAPLLGRAVVCGEIPQFGGHGAFPAAAPCHSDGDLAWLFSPKFAITMTLMFQANSDHTMGYSAFIAKKQLQAVSQI
jgi:hypothetical protein